MSRLKNVDKVVAFGFQAFVKKYLIDYFNEQFFDRPVEAVVYDYKRMIGFTLGQKDVKADHLIALHKLGYLPIRIKAVPEGTRVPLRVPMLTIENTLPEFFWVTNYLETLMSCELWQATTSATIAYEYKKLLTSWADKTSDQPEFVQFQAHDFSMRGMGSIEAAQLSGAGHLLSFVGTDTIPAVIFLEEYYNADIEKELVGTSIPATEHSVMEAYGTDEMISYKRFITEVYPTGFVSIVSDTWNLWAVLTKVIAGLKKEIMARDGRIVIRPDSGDPVDILCGKADGDSVEECKGVIEILWEIFGGTTNSKGFKQLDSHIGAIYGDAITLDRANLICEKLAEKGFSSTNVVFGVGSYTYQYNTRDTFGFALKSTFGVFGGEEKLLFKDPVTDTANFKKSATGLVTVLMNNKTHEIVLQDGLDLQGREYAHNMDILQDIFVDGKLIVDDTLANIRARLVV
jgi:nicotinamide phosphoribosyltransferase